MFPRRFDILRERLLRAGVAPRHVRRYLRELQEHHDDLLRAELSSGASPQAAHDAAWARLGTDEGLVQSMLQRPELRSRAARFPALAFGAVPVLGWIGAPIALHLFLSLLPEGSRQTKVDDGFIAVYHAATFAYTRLLPVVLGVILLHLAANRRLRLLWPVVGAGAIDVLAGTLTVYSSPGQLGISSALLPWLLPLADIFGPRQLAPLAEGLSLAACLLALSFLVQRVMRRIVAGDELTRTTSDTSLQ
jgi:hypothetical protein